jgi:hypothetical protein
MKNQTPTRIGYERGFNWRSNGRIGWMFDRLDPADLLSVLLGGLFELLL